MTLAITVVDLLFRQQLIYQRGDGFLGTTMRCISSSFVHWDNDHLLWNMIAMLLIGIVLVDFSEKMFWHGVVLSPFVIGLTVHLFCPGTTAYCGFSGVGFTLLTLVCGSFIQSDRTSLKIYGWITIIASIFKVLWELATGTPFFAEGSTFYVLPAAHMAGVVVGVGILCFHRFKILQPRAWNEVYLLFFGDQG